MFNDALNGGNMASLCVNMQIINEHYRMFSWVAELIQVFIAISVTVSFLVMGSAMKHTSKSPFAYSTAGNKTMVTMATSALLMLTEAYSTTECRHLAKLSIKTGVKGKQLA